MYHVLNVISSEKLHRNNILPGTSPLSASVYYIHKLKKNNLSLIFFTLSFFHSFYFPFFLLSWEIYNTHGGERRSKEKNCRVCINISRQHLANNNLLRNPVKRNISSSSLFNLLHVLFHENIFFLTNSNEYLIRKQLGTFTSMQSYFSKKKNIYTPLILWTFTSVGFSIYIYKKNRYPSELRIFSNNHKQLYNFSYIKHTAIKQRGKKI